MTGTAPTPDRDAAGRAGVAEYRCRRCGHVLGTVEGGWLRLGGILVRSKVRLECPGCGEVHRHHVPSPVDNLPPGAA